MAELIRGKSGRTFGD
ncbi:hypothetical protein [Peptoniphilus harei]|nr:hypothetical protein [Peptoniphilus harei]